jgi:lysophospholipase L1-like esterase
MKVRISPGPYEICGKKLRVTAEVALDVVPADTVAVSDEPQVMGDDQPQAYRGGVFLKGSVGPLESIRLHDCVDASSVVITSAPNGGGTLYQEGKDYVLDHEYGGLGRMAKGGISATETVYVSYRYALMRIDLVQVSREGKFSVKKGKPEQICCVPPEADAGMLPAAHVWVPYRATGISADQIMPVPCAGSGGWRDLIAVRGKGRLSRTRRLLRQGKPVTIVFLGDSVTAGGTASSREKTFVGLTPILLKELYPNAQINAINAGVGGTSSDFGLQRLDKDVLAHNPDLVVVEFVNDMGFSPDKIKSNYAELARRIREVGLTDIIILTPHFMRPSWMGNFPTACQALRDAAHQIGAALGDTAAIWARLASVGILYESLLTNGINHPNDLGHEFYARTIVRLLEP